MEEIYPTFRPLFTDKAAQALHTKVNNMIHQRDVMHGPVPVTEFLAKLRIKSAKGALDRGDIGYRRVCDPVVFLGSRSHVTEIGSAIAKVAETVNHLADKGYITGALTPLSIIELTCPDVDQKYLIVSYVAVTQAGKVYIDQNLKHMNFEEGGTPLSVKEQI
jgi:hypothetical protein